MLFNSGVFFVFIALFAVGYFALHGVLRLGFTCVASYIFYSWWDWRFTGLLFVTTAICWAGAIRIDEASSNRAKKAWLSLAIALCLVILGFFKYFGFFQENFRALLDLLGVSASWPVLKIVLPVGISFFVFQGISYVVDVARGDIPAEKSLLRLATFKAFFPQLVAGPVVRASDFLPQLREDQSPTSDDVLLGFCMVAWGYVMKVAMADTLAAVVDPCFLKPGGMSEADVLVGVVFYAFQIYGDFAGYSLIAIGIARCFGYKFPTNFARPYFSSTFSEFWRRWHISLSTWLKDYLYIPLGGSRASSLLTYRNLLLTMLIGGLWHGASWNFVIWGGLHGVFLIMERLLGVGRPGEFENSVWAWLFKIMIRVPLVFCGVCVAWVFFRAATLDDAQMIISKMFSLEAFNFSKLAGKFQVAKGFFLIAIIVAGDWVCSVVNVKVVATSRPQLAGLFVGLCILIIAALGTFGGSSFIYFQF